MSNLPDRPVVCITKFLFKEDVANLTKDHDDFSHKCYMESYGLDGLCLITVNDLPPCQRKQDTDYEAEPNADGVYPPMPHEHKAWCDTFNVAIPFIRGAHRDVLYTHKGEDGKEFTDRRIAWGWDGNREKPSLTPSFLTEHYHCTDDEVDPSTKRLPGVWVHFHCFIGDPYGHGTGRYGPGNLDILESHIKTQDGRHVPMRRE